MYVYTYMYLHVRVYIILCVAVRHDVIVSNWICNIISRLVMWTLSFVYLSLLVLGTLSQQYPRFEHDGTTYTNNSFINRLQVGQDSNALRCVTDQSGCCTSPDAGDWFDENGNQVHQGVMGATTLYVTRGDGQVNLNRFSSTGSSGMLRCQIPDSVGTMQNLYIYTGDTESGEWYIVYRDTLSGGVFVYIRYIHINTGSG